MNFWQTEHLDDVLESLQKIPVSNQTAIEERATLLAIVREALEASKLHKD